MKNLIFTLCVFFITCIGIYGQDIHWSQPSNSLLYQNPAFTGINGKFTLNANYRNQWNAVDVGYKSYLIAGDYRFGKNEPQNISLSVGGILYSDIAGEGNYHTANGGITFSCLVKANDRVRIGAGFGYNIIQSSLQINNFSWGSQFDGQNYNSSINTGENFGSASKLLSDLNAGIAIRYDKNETSSTANHNTQLIFGYSINHVNRPDISVNGGGNRLNIKHVLFSTGNISLKDNIGIKPTILFYKQGALNEITFGSLYRITIGQHSIITGNKKGAALSFGALYRINDAIIPTVEVEVKNYIFGISYDVNVSGLTTFSNYRGGIEITFRLINIGNYLFEDHYK